MISEILIYSGPITYIAVWIIFIIINILFTLDSITYNIFLIYAICPVGAIIQSGLGFLLQLL